MSKLARFQSGDNAYAHHATNVMWNGIMGEWGNFYRQKQVTAMPNFSYNETVAVKQIEGEPGLFTGITAKTYEPVAGMGVHKTAIATIQLNANHQRCTYITDYTFKAQENICADADTEYDVKVYKSDDLGKTYTEVTTGWTLDKCTGIITFSATMAGWNVYWSGYYYATGARYWKGNYTHAYDEFDTSYNYRLLPLLNPWFELWTDSTTPMGWTKQGDVSRESTALQGMYDLRIGANGSSWNSITQTLDMGSQTIDRCLFIATLRTTVHAYIQVRMGAGDYESCSFIPTASQVNKWVTLMVESRLDTKSEITVKIAPQILETEVSTVYVAFAGLLTGSKM